jgi:hypothetical protein
MISETMRLCFAGAFLISMYVLYLVTVINVINATNYMWELL